MKNSSKNGLLWGMLFAWVVIIFTLCALPKQDIPDPGINIPHLDKVVHWGMFLITSILICWLVEFRGRISLKLAYVVAIGVSFVYGGLIEILQYHFFNRGGDVWDLLADVVGGVTGCLLYPTVNKLKDRLFVKKRPFHKN